MMWNNYELSKSQTVSNMNITPQPYGLAKAAYTVSDTMEVLSIGRTKLYQLMQSGDLKPRKLGRRTLILASDITALLDKLHALPDVSAAA
jgi:predicted DNA-binding transcriptional regulator AlpA